MYYMTPKVENDSDPLDMNTNPCQIWALTIGSFYTPVSIGVKASKAEQSNNKIPHKSKSDSLRTPPRN